MTNASARRRLDELPTPLDTVREIRNSPAPEIAEFCQKHGLNVFVIIGSVAKGTTHSMSDVDLAIWPRSNEFDLLKLFADLVPLLGTERIDIINLKSARPFLPWNVATGGKLLYEAEPGLWAEIGSRAVRSYEDVRRFERYRMMSIDKSLKEWGVRK